ncbi:ferredoxin reductase [soil metagenome]
MTVVDGGWTVGTLVDKEVTEALVRLRFAVPDRVAHRAGQHYVLRLRAEDGYTASRSYSVASDPGDPGVELMIECLPGGEVSAFMHDEARPGDLFELRGPIGGWFTWDAGSDPGPVLCIGGGTGVVPFVAMSRQARRLGRGDRIRTVAVGRGRATLPYVDELIDAGAFVALTRENLGGRVAAPPYPDEVDPMLTGVQRVYVCGSAGFASYATRLLTDLGAASDLIRVEQFGATE